MNRHISNKKDEWTTCSIVMSISAFVLVLFSFVAPILFTRSSICSRISFSETGQIGDTIGGLMNPFIALSGVIMTFVAFYIQKKTNDKLWEKTERQETNRVEDGFLLIQKDLAYMYEKIKGIDTYLHNFIQTFYNQKHFNEWNNTLGHFLASMYKRMAEENRSNMMHILSSKGVANPSAFLYGYYELADYFSEQFGKPFSDTVNSIDDLNTNFKSFNSTISELSNYLKIFQDNQGHPIECIQSFLKEYDEWDNLNYGNISSFIQYLTTNLVVIEEQITQEVKLLIFLDQQDIRIAESVKNVQDSLSKAKKICENCNSLFDKMKAQYYTMHKISSKLIAEISILQDMLFEVQSSFEN